MKKQQSATSTASNTKNGSNPTRGRKWKTDVLALEPRILFDGAAIATGLEGLVSAEPDVQMGDADNSGDQHDLLNALSGEYAPPHDAHEIAFVDTSVEGYEDIVSAFGAHVEIVLIDNTGDGVEQIASILENRSDVDAVHIVSHGRAGTLDLGTTKLTAASMTGKHADEMAVIRAAMNENGDILIYGCNFGQSARGEAAVEALARATGADVAASNDLTGAAQLGGDWDLEVTRGQIDTGSLVSTRFDGVLADVNISAPSGSLSQVDGNSNNVPVGNTLGVGGVATWSNAGTVNGQAIDVRAEVLSLGPGDTVRFEDPSATASDDLSFLLFSEGTGSPAELQVRWTIVLAGTTIQASGEIDFTIGDIDGIGGAPNTRETVLPQLDGLTSYGAEAVTNIQFNVNGGQVSASGTQNQNGEATSWANFKWVDVSSWDVTYRVDANSLTPAARFLHDGDGDLVFTNLVNNLLLQIDADGDDSTTGGNDYIGSFTENGGPVPVVDSDVTITQNTAIGTTLDGATITLTNAQPDDVLAIGALPGGITSNVDTSVPGQITVTLSGNASIADYEAALQLVTFENTSEAPNTSARLFDISVVNATFGTTSNIATSTLNITALNDAPIAQDDANATVSDTVLSTTPATGVILPNDTDVDGDTLTVQAVNGVAANVGNQFQLGSGALLTLAADGSYVYDPNGAFGNLLYNQTATDSFTYTVTDGAGATDTATVTINITGANTPPVAGDDTFSATNDGNTLLGSVITASGGGADTDVDGQTLTVVAVNGAGGNVGGQITLASGALLTQNPDGSFSYDPNGFTGPTDSFTYSVSDGVGGTDTATVTINIVNLPPVATVQNYTVAEDTPISLSGISFSDPDGATGDVTVALNVDSGTLTINDLVAGGITAAQVNGNGTGAVTITAPLAAINTTFADPNGATFTGAADFNGVVNLAVGINDNGNGDAGNTPLSDTQAATITVTPVNDLPVVDLDDNDSSGQTGTGYQTTYTENQPPVPIADSDALITDVDNTTIESATITLANGQVGDLLTVGNLPAGISLVGPAPGSLTAAGIITVQLTGSASLADYRDAVRAIGYSSVSDDPDTTQRQVTVVVNDGTSDSAAATALIDVIAVNDPPSAVDDTALTDEDTALSVPVASGVINLNDSDLEGDTLSVSQINNAPFVANVPVTLPSGATVTMDPNGAFTYDPNGRFETLGPGAATTDSFSYTITDGNGGSDTATVTLTINGLNDDPVIVDPAVAQPDPGNPIPAADPNTVIPVQNIVDGQDFSVGPLIDVDNYVLDPDGNANLTFTTTDMLPPGLTLNTNGTITGTIDNSASQGGAASDGVYTITVTISDGNGGTATVPLTLNVTNPNPTAVDDTSTGNENNDQIGNVITDALTGDADTAPDSDAITVSDVNGQPVTTGTPGVVTLTHGTLTMNADGSWTFEPNGTANALAAGANVTETVTYTITDEDGGTDTATLAIDITGVDDTVQVIDPNDPSTDPSDPAYDPTNPTVIPDPDNLIPDVAADDGATPADIPAGDYFADADGDPLTFAASNLPPGLTIDPGTGVISGTLDNSASQGGNGGPGVYDVTITASGPGGATASTTVTYTVTNPNPTAVDDASTGDENNDQTGNVITDALTGDADTAPDSDAITVSDVNGQAVTIGAPGVVTLTHGTLTMNADGSWTFEPNGTANALAAGASTTETVTYTITDEDGGTDTATLAIDITGVDDTVRVIDPNDPSTDPSDPSHDPTNPTLIADPDNLIPDVAADDGATPADVPAGDYFADAEGDPLTFAASNLPPGLTIDPGTGVISGTLDNSASQGGNGGPGVYNTVISATDANGGTATTTVTYTITNPVPIAVDTLEDAEQVDRDEVSIPTAQAFSDPDGDTLTYSATGLPDGLSIDPVTGEISGTLAIDASLTSPYSITVTADDGDGGSVSLSFEMKVDPYDVYVESDRKNGNIPDAAQPVATIRYSNEGGEGSDGVSLSQILNDLHSLNSDLDLSGDVPDAIRKLSDWIAARGNGWIDQLANERDGRYAINLGTGLHSAEEFSKAGYDLGLKTVVLDRLTLLEIRLPGVEALSDKVVKVTGPGGEQLPATVLRIDGTSLLINKAVGTEWIDLQLEFRSGNGEPAIWNVRVNVLSGEIVADTSINDLSEISDFSSQLQSIVMKDFNNDCELLQVLT